MTMERSGEKVAYYCSELESRPNETHLTNNNNNNNNNNNMVNDKFDMNDKREEIQHQTIQNLQDGQSTNSSSDYPHLVTNHFNNNNQPVNDQQHSNIDSSNNIMQAPQQQHHPQQLVQNAPATLASQSNRPLNTATSQPQYLISSSNRQQLTNVTHYPNHVNSNAMFQNQASRYLINSNNQLYQSGMQQQQQQQAQFNQVRPPVFSQHHKTPSQGDESRSQDNQQDLHLRQQMQQQQQIQVGDQANLTTSRSMTHTDFNRIRRRSEHLGLTSEVGLESLNLDFEAMLMNENQTPANVNNVMIMQKHHLDPNQNIDRMPRTLNTRNNFNDINDRPNNGGDMASSVGYGRPGQSETVCHSKDGLFMVENRSEDNIYEEIDIKTINRLQAEYPVDTISLRSDTWKKKNAKKFLGASFTRWFSTRKKSSNSQNSDQEENPYIDSRSIKRPRLISLPETIPDNLTPEQLKRRLIVGSIVDSENSYTNSLYRLIYEYKKPLEEADPPILSANKIGIIFFCLDQILQFHKLFGLALSHHVQEWDEKEMIGSVFTTNFSKPMVLDIYSGFINNFTNAMETARRASKSKAFAQFLHDKSVNSPDRLSFFGSMVKPVQRFPQFILLLSDLLKHTPYNHPDRMPLQRALTELESLADRLNERKRDAERHFAVKQLLKDHLNESHAHSQRYLIRQDDTCLLDIDTNTNTVLKSKSRKMYLLNDMLICVTTPSNRLKFAVPLSEIMVVESITPAISDSLARTNIKSLTDPSNPLPSPQNHTIERMECERQSLVHDLELMSQIAMLVTSLRFQYNGLNPAIPEQICMGIREEIRKKEFQMTLIDRSCLQLRLQSKNNKDTLVVQFSNPDSKREWLIDVRLTKLALDRSNTPGWEFVTDPSLPAHQATLCSIGQRAPLFVKSLAIFKSEQSHLTCALHYYLRQAPFIGENPAGVLWICNVSASASSLGALATNGAEISLIHSYELSESHVTCLESVGSTLWIGLRQGRIIVIDANSPSEWVQFASLDVQSEVTCIKYFGHFVYVGLIKGVVAVFDAINFDKPFLIQLSQSPVTCLLPINDEVFACSHNRIWRIRETNIIDSLVVQNDNILSLDEEPRPNLLAHCGSGIWVSLIESPIIKLYHAETLKHLVDINIANSVRRFLIDYKEEIKITVTSMMATRGLLWIGTNVGMIATLTLPRLQGVPLVSGIINVALHRFLGPVNIMLNLSAGSECIPQLPFNNRNQPQTKANQVSKNEEAEAIYGQYADLMNVGDYIGPNGKSCNLGDMPTDRMAWEFPSVNISAMNVSDDSGSSGSSGAIYQDGVPRGMKQIENRAVVGNQTMMPPGNQQLGGAQAAPQSANVQNRVFNGQIGQQNQVADLNQLYDKAQSHSTTYNQGSLDGIQSMPQDPHMSLKQIEQQKRMMISASQTHLAKADQSGSQADYGSQSGKMSNRFYDQPAQLIQQQQQVIQQARQAGSNIVDGNMLSGMRPSASTYGPFGCKSKSFMTNKTVLVLAGGNGYQRIAKSDNKPFGEHAHCIIWEYKA